MKAYTSRHLNHSGKVEAFMPEEGSSDRASTWDIVSLDEAVDTDDGSRREAGTHLKYGKHSLYDQADPQISNLGHQPSFVGSSLPSSLLHSDWLATARTVLSSRWRDVYSLMLLAVNRVRLSSRQKVRSS